MAVYIVQPRLTFPDGVRRYGGQEPLEIRVEKASEDKTDDR